MAHANELIANPAALISQFEEITTLVSLGFGQRPHELGHRLRTQVTSRSVASFAHPGTNVLSLQKSRRSLHDSTVGLNGRFSMSPPLTSTARTRSPFAPASSALRQRAPR
jgi:hypothetical protein